MSLPLTLLAFLFALAVLITIHEYGHYRVAVAAGVKVLRFSIGFGKPLLRWTRGPDRTEYVIAALPLGGYVRMLDEREGPVDPAEQHRAFNRASLGKRAAIVAAGPAANLLLAVVLFAVVALIGQQEPRAILAAPPAQSAAALAGVRAGDVVEAVREGGSQTAVRSWTELRWQLLDAALNGESVELLLRRGEGGPQRGVTLDFAGQQNQAESPGFLDRFGLQLQGPPPELQKVLPDGPAAAAGLQAGDVIKAVDGQPLASANALISAVQQSDGRPLRLTVQRGGQTFERTLSARRTEVGGQAVWRIDAVLGGRIPMVEVRRGPIEALAYGAQRTWDLSVLTVKTLGRMIIGEASLRNLSGPVTIADYAGQSAALGWLPYLSFLAVISVSLGVLNLLPLPVLDGGHLLYYAFEGVTRRAVSQRWQERLQQGGLAVIALMMMIALYNDLTRLLG